MKITIQNQTYTYCDQVKEDEGVRAAFDLLAQETFGLSFKPWYDAGWWSERYVPHVLLEDGIAAANVSVNRMDMTVDGCLRHYIQLGTVMTGKKYRDRGLCRTLLERVLEQWSGRCDGIFLYANDSVLDLYPKFGFEKAEEWEYVLPDRPSAGNGEVCQMNMRNQKDVNQVLEYFRLSNPFSVSAMVENPGLLMFYCQGGLSEMVWYVPEQDAVAVAGDENGRRILYDVYCGPGRDLLKIASAVSGGTREVTLGFTPAHTAGMDCRIHKEEDITLFLLNGGKYPMSKYKCMFPMLCHA